MIVKHGVNTVVAMNYIVNVIIFVVVIVIFAIVIVMILVAKMGQDMKILLSDK